MLVLVGLLACMKEATSETSVKSVATDAWMARSASKSFRDHSVAFNTEDSWAQYCGDMDISIAVPTGW